MRMLQSDSVTVAGTWSWVMRMLQCDICDCCRHLELSGENVAV